MISIAKSFSGEEKLLRAIYGPCPVRQTAWVWGSPKPAPQNPNDTAYARLRLYPHCTKEIATQVASEWMAFGKEDAEHRGIDRKTWLWRRSRFLAGYK